MTRKNKQSRKDQPSGETELCYRHERPLSLFCRDEDCHKLLCHVCYIKHHNGHEAVDLISEAKKYKHELKDVIQHATDELTKCRDILNTQNDNTTKYLDDIEVNLNKFDDMMKEISDDPVKSITLHEPYKNFIEETKEQLATGLKSLAKNIGSLGKRLGWKTEDDDDDDDEDGVYEIEDRYEKYEEEYEEVKCPEYTFAEGDGFGGKLAHYERKWYKLSETLRDTVYSVCSGAGLFVYLTILHADNDTMLGLPKQMLVAIVNPSADKLIPQHWINSDPYYFHNHG